MQAAPTDVAIIAPAPASGDTTADAQSPPDATLVAGSAGSESRSQALSAASGNRESTASSTSSAGIAVQTADVGLQIATTPTFASYKWLWSLECGGQSLGAINIPETGLRSFDTDGPFGTLRFGKVPDPDNPAKKVLAFVANASDGLVAGAPRCEATFSPSLSGKLPVGQDFWFAFGVRLQNWINGTDEQLLSQWHWSNGSIPLQPFFALYLKGDRLEFDSRFDGKYPPSIASTQTTALWRDSSSVPVNRWIYFTVKARISPDPAAAPYVKVWRDGQMIVDRAGPIGYNYPEVAPYAKVGHYEWIAPYNVWNASLRTKTILYRTPSLIHDQANRYREADVRGFVQAN